MSGHNQFTPTSVRARSRSAMRSVTFDYSTDEDSNDTPKTIISFYEYHRTRGDVKAEKVGSIIRWPLPVSFTEPSALGYENYNLGLLGNDPDSITRTLAAQVKAGIDLVGSLGSQEGIIAGGTAALSMGLNTFATMPIARDTGFGRWAQQRQGIVANPHTTVLFNGVPLRRFTLNWRFSPRSKHMADQLARIIFEIKRNIYPAETDSGFALDYPNLAVITFPNTKIPSIRKCFVESFAVTHSSGASMEFYRDGTPIDWEVTMSMFETEIITRDVLDGKTRGDVATPEELIGSVVRGIAAAPGQIADAISSNF